MNLPAPSTQEEVAHVLDVLAFGEIEIEGRLVDASNVALLGQLELDGIRTRVIYKPVQGERSLWDFPDGTLAAREAAAFELSAVGGWNLVPPTVLREGPLGPGSVQLWVDAVEGATQSLVRVVTPAELAPGWLPVFEAQLADGTAVVVAHADLPELASAAVFDVVISTWSSTMRTARAPIWCWTSPARYGGLITASAVTSCPSCAPCCGDGWASRYQRPNWPGWMPSQDG